MFETGISPWTIEIAQSQEIVNTQYTDESILSGGQILQTQDITYFLCTDATMEMVSRQPVGGG